MRVSVLLAHPNAGSFCHALADAAHAALVASGHTVRFHDLYREGFSPLLSAAELELQRSNDPLVDKHCREIVEADGLVIVHPNWWSQPPAILKGWVDRVLRPGVAYSIGQGKGAPLGLLKVRTALVITTAATAHADEVARFGDPLDTLWRKCTLAVCGVQDVRRLAFGPLQTADADRREAWLVDTDRAIHAAFKPG